VAEVFFSINDLGISSYGKVAAFPTMFRGLKFCPDDLIGLEFELCAVTPKRKTIITIITSAAENWLRRSSGIPALPPSLANGELHEPSVGRSALPRSNMLPLFEGPLRM
jgi:hypothetical protein